MGLYFSTPRVFGFGFSTRIGGGRKSPSKGGEAFLLFFLGFILFSLALKYWHVTLPIALVLGALVLLGKREQRRHKNTQPVPQVSVSNRR